MFDHILLCVLNDADGKIRRFHALKSEWGYEKLISLDTFNDASNGLLVEDCCAFGVDIFVMKYNEGKGEIFSLVKQPKDNIFAWKIPKISLPHSSPESNVFAVENYSWYEIVLFSRIILRTCICSMYIFKCIYLSGGYA